MTLPSLPLTLVVPVYNEEQRLKSNRDSLVQSVGRWPPGSQMIIVDDGSTDGTAAVADRMTALSDRVLVVRRPHLGKGAAVEYGLQLARTPVSGYADVDLSTPIFELERLFELSIHTGAMVIGSRGVQATQVGDRQSRTREFLGRLFNLWARLLIAPGVRDTQCGAKVAPTDIWRSLFKYTEEQSFAWDAEVVALAMACGAVVTEEGVAWSHDPSTRVRVVRDGIAMAVSVFRIAFRIRRLRRSCS